MAPNDLRHAFRMLARNPGYTLAAVAALALGIGANTAIFSIINTVLLKPLTYPDPDRIVQLMNTSPNGTYPWASIPNFSNWRDQTSVLEEVAAFTQGGSAMNVTGADPEQVRVARVTADYFRLFGARFVYGRGFTPDEDRPDSGAMSSSAMPFGSGDSPPTRELLARPSISAASPTSSSA